MTTAQWPEETALLWAIVLIAEHRLSRMPSGSSAIWLVTLCGGDDEDSRILGRKALLDMIGRPRALGLVLGDGIGVLAGVSEGRFVKVAGPSAADIEQHEADRPADRGIGAIARAEGVDATI